MAVVTATLIEKIIQSGPLTLARNRVRSETTLPDRRPQWAAVSAWCLICDEVLDTEHGPDWYDGIIAELDHRGFGDEQVDAMRRFAWQTAGWLNYDKMLWEWVDLNESDIRMALDWQLRERLITRAQHHDGLAFIENPRGQ